MWTVGTHTLASSARSRPISVNIQRSMPHPASRRNLGFVGRNKKRKLNCANESDIRHCSVLSLRSWSLLTFRKQMSATKDGKIHGRRNWWQGYLTVMLLSSIGEAVKAKSLEKEVNKTYMNFSYNPMIEVRSVTQTALVSLCGTCTQCKSEFSEEAFVVFL
jgi:hypothetical protein